MHKLEEKTDFESEKERNMEKFANAVNSQFDTKIKINPKAY